MSLAGLVEPPDQAGELLKSGHSRGGWSPRFLVLKGSNLFYFKDRRDAYKKHFKIHGFIPLENAKIETELPPSPDKRKSSKGHIITITLHSSVALSTKHAFYVLAAPSAEVRDAWVNAMWQAAIPRSDLVQHLNGAGKLADVLASYAQNVQACYPVADAAVLSTGGRARTAVANMGEMAAAIRRHQVHKPTQAIDDITQLPVVASDLKRPASVLARTASGALVSAPSSSVLPQAEGEELVRRAASASGAIGGTPFRTRTPTPDSPANSPGPSKLRPPGQVAVTAAAGPGAAAALASGSAGGSAASTPREQEKARAQQQMRVIEAQLKQLEDQEHKR